MSHVPPKSDAKVLTPDEALAANVIPARIASLPGLWRVYYAPGDFRARFHNGWEQLATTLHELHSTKFYSACYLVHDLPPREVDWDRG